MPPVLRIPQLQIKEAADGGFYWRLTGKNGEPMATSETYSRREDARRGANDAVEAMRTAIIVDPHYVEGE